MSRKDPRRTLRVPVSRGVLSCLRRRARGRSLGDALRRLAGVHDGPIPDAPVNPVRWLPVQVPRSLRARLLTLAAETGRPPEDLLAGIGEAAQSAADR